mmetsp:Transcript_12634/g.49185  ORF Transcript_12634/g.49185 Transcript_12634/m.49185 type:complete len:284 (+) Transcript_12634:454-1305(+)
MSSLGHHANDCSNAPGGDTDGVSNSTAPTDPGSNAAGSRAPAAHEPSAPQCVSSAAMTPAQESCESPPMMTARLAFGTSALSSRRRSAAYPCQSSKFQFNRYRPAASKALAAPTGTALPPSPKDSAFGGAVPVQSVHASSAARQDPCPVGGVAPSPSSASAAFSKSGLIMSITGEACAITCHATPDAALPVTSSASHASWPGPAMDSFSSLLYASRPVFMARIRRSSELPGHDAGAFVADVAISFVRFAQTLPLGLAFGSVRAVSLVSSTWNDATSPKCTVRL